MYVVRIPSHQFFLECHKDFDYSSIVVVSSECSFPFSLGLDMLDTDTKTHPELPGDF